MNAGDFILVKGNKGGKPLHLYAAFAILRVIELVARLDITSLVYNRFTMLNNIRISFVILHLYKLVCGILEFKSFPVEIINEGNKK